MQGRVPSNFDELDVLSEVYEFLPNSTTCRPSPEQISLKQNTLTVLEKEWVTVYDYICAVVFGCQTWYTVDGRRQSTRSITGLKRFQPSLFPYQIRSGYHYVMWYGSSDKPSEQSITQDISNSIKEIIGPEAPFSFGWYENPKMSVPEVCHYQVFWDV